ncbi:polynucleotide 5'-triphosphatase [Nematocida sp. AWRm77]|nr:polynucleotide 5'-triphosphatase [Nematocida sp. AWRm77]
MGLEGQQENAHVIAALLKSLPDALGKTTEIEVRMGLVIDKATNQRLAVSFMHPCVIERSDTLRFHATVEEKDFRQLSKHYAEKEGSPVCKTIVDTLIKGGRRSEITEVNGKKASEPPVIIKKTKMKMIDVFCPQSKYDIRIGISEEVVIEDNLGFSTVFGTREKKRQTFDCKTHLIELTEVSSGKDIKETKGITYEVEFEAVNALYKKAAFAQTVVGIMSSISSILSKKNKAVESTNTSTSAS